MRKFWLPGLIGLFLIGATGGCPNDSANYLEGAYSPPPETGAADTNPEAKQSLTQVTQILYAMANYEMAVSVSSGEAADISQSTEGSVDWNLIYVSDGASRPTDTPPPGSGQPPPPPPTDPGRGGGSGGSGGGGGGNGDDGLMGGYSPRGGVSYTGGVSGTDYEVIVGCCSATFSASKGATAHFSSDGTLDALSLPGFATLPNLLVQVGGAGASFTYDGVDSIGLTYTITVTTRSVQQTDSGFDATLDVRLRAAGGSLVETGDAVHTVSGTISGTTLNWASTTHYDVLMAASAAGQPDVGLDVSQEWRLSGLLSR
ncbi:MAG: hypothetical protein HZB38_13610 [Planctomycetes bacterium]|nr:hypothetical protein [Planctomycetota bacterium]